MPTIDPAARELAAVEYADATPTPAAAPVDVRVAGAVTVTERPARTITTEAVAVGVAPARIVNAVISRARLFVQNDSTTGEPIFIGGPDVTPGTGYRLGGGQSIELTARCALYACVAGGTSQVRVLSEHNDG